MTLSPIPGHSVRAIMTDLFHERPHVHNRCTTRFVHFPKGARQKGGDACFQCGVSQPTPLNFGIAKLSSKDAVDLIHVYAGVCPFTVRQFLQEHDINSTVNETVGMAWIVAELDSCAQTWREGPLSRVTTFLEERLLDLILSNIPFGYAYTGPVQHGIMLCAEKPSVEMILSLNNPYDPAMNVAIRPFSPDFTLLQSLCTFLLETEKTVLFTDVEAWLAPLCKRYEKKMVWTFFAFLCLCEMKRVLTGKNANEYCLTNAGAFYRILAEV